MFRELVAHGVEIGIGHRCLESTWSFPEVIGGYHDVWPTPGWRVVGIVRKTEGVPPLSHSNYFSAFSPNKESRGMDNRCPTPWIEITR